MHKYPVSNLVIKKRLILLFFLMSLLTIALILRLGWLQVVVGEELKEKARRQWDREIPSLALRGSIYDRHGKLLAGSEMLETVVALPLQIESPDKTAAMLSKILPVEEQRILELITRERAAVYIERKVESEVARAVRRLGLPGIIFTRESNRYYPSGSLASQVMGFVGMDQGWGGLEIYYEEELRGRDGKIVFLADARGREIPHEVRRYIPSQDGFSLVLTIDETIQFIVERELARAMLEFEADQAMAIAVNPRTGEVLAASSKPAFDPGEHMDYDPKNWLLSPVTSTFEPGSTFKLATLAAAVEENLFHSDEPFFCAGKVDVAGAGIGCWTESRGGHGAINFLEVVLGSCNPGFVTLAQRLGEEKLYAYIRAFGFGSRTGIDYPGEGRGIIFSPEQLGPVELATTSFGQGISVTPLQQVMFVSAIANGGDLLKPYLVKEVKDSNGNVVRSRETQKIRQVISEETAKKVTEIMEVVVAEGNAVNAQIHGHRIAGKTGTAQKIGPAGEYIVGEYILSFIGFAPAEDPQILLFVSVDNVRRGPQWGGQVSAPIFRRIMEDLLRYLNIQPQVDPEGIVLQEE